jgi:hypothetical protein
MPMPVFLVLSLITASYNKFVGIRPNDTTKNMGAFPSLI